MAAFEIIHQGRDAGPAGDYLYEIRRNGRRVANLRHNHRGEEFYIRISSLGAWEPFEDKVLEGGGPKALRLSEDGEALLLERLSQQRI